MLWQNIQEYTSRPLLHWKQQRWIKGVEMRLLSVWDHNYSLGDLEVLQGDNDFDFNFDLRTSLGEVEVRGISKGVKHYLLKKKIARPRLFYVQELKHTV